MIFTIAIPALNEEESIGLVIEGCFGIKKDIIAQTMIEEVRVVVVSDGSSDRTVEIAKGYKDVILIEFKKNRGYGAAIKAGWALGGGDILGFLDADGTCDPKYFIPMCKKLVKENLDIVLGNRMGPDSKMPKIRRLGNRIFAALLGFLSKK